MKPNELKAARAYLGLTQKQLADWQEYSVRSVAYWEAGRKPVPKSLADLLRWLVWDEKPVLPKIVADDIRREVLGDD